MLLPFENSILTKICFGMIFEDVLFLIFLFFAILFSQWEFLKTVIPNLIRYLVCHKHEIAGQARNDKMGFLEMYKIY